MRDRLIDLSRYFFYAVGEILLVVIGILIALQINNVNEHPLERIKYSEADRDDRPGGFGRNTGVELSEICLRS